MEAPLEKRRITAAVKAIVDTAIAHIIHLSRSLFHGLQIRFGGEMVHVGLQFRKTRANRKKAARHELSGVGYAHCDSGGADLRMDVRHGQNRR